MKNILKKIPYPIALIIPIEVVLLFLLIFPLIVEIWVGLTNWTPLLGTNWWHAKFVGLKNYFDIIFKDPRFLMSVARTILITTVCVLVELGLGLVYALLFVKDFRGKKICVSIMLLPMTLSAEGLPYYLRAIGTLPAIYFFPALALDACLERGQRLLGTRRGGQVFAVVAAGILLVAFGLLAANTYRDYFSTWHTNPRNDDDRHVAMVYVADYLREYGWQGELYISTEFVEHPTLAFLAGLSDEQFSDIHWFDGRQSLPLPAQDAEATYVFLTETPGNADLLSRVPGLQRIDTGYDRFGRPVFDVYTRDRDSWPEPTRRGAKWSWEVKFEAGDAPGVRHEIASPTDFGGVLSLEGYDAPTQPLAPGEQVDLVLYWRLQQRSQQDLSIFAHLLDSESHIVGEYDGNGYPSRFWDSEGDELLLGTMPLIVKPDTPPGEYQLEVGIYDRVTGERLPVNENGQMVADRLLLVPVRVR